MAYVKLVGTANRHTDWTTEVILEKDDQGNPTKVVRAGEPVELSKSDQDRLEGMGYSFESSTKQELDASQEAQQVGGDVAQSGPVFSSSSKQSADADDDK